MGIREKLKEVRENISSYPGIAIVAATKTRSIAEIGEAINAGIKIIGENRVQEAEEKFYSMPEETRSKAKWQMIGHLQSNKAKSAANIFSCIQSVDSIKLAEEINRRCREINKIMPILFEINIAGEKTKFGFMPGKAELTNAIEKISRLGNIKLQGLMLVEPFCENPENARQHFKKAKNLFEELKNQEKTKGFMRILSMGMSNSYKVAAEEGSSMVRIGTALFGARNS